MTEKLQKHGQSPTAMLQQNKRDDARLSFIKKESSHLFCANAQTANSRFRVSEKEFVFNEFYSPSLLLWK